MFYWRISRLINFLNGYDPLVNVQISANEQIAQIIEVTRKTLENKNRYDVNLHKQMVKNEMVDRNYEENIIQEWISNIE